MSIWVLHLPENRLPAPEQIMQGGEDMLHLPFDEWPDATHMHSPAELRRALKVLQPDSPPETIARTAERVWQYAHAIHAEDIIAIPLQSEGEVVFCSALLRPIYEGERYLLRVRWFPKVERIASFARFKRLFEHSDSLLQEVSSPQARGAIRDRLALPGTRFRRWKWLMAVFMLLGLVRMALRLMHQQSI